uniref:WAP domain-containing protein n=1 Tax=Pogona vitticeps TaxID=103695 RepID=A0ABM5G4U1_9SAUR
MSDLPCPLGWRQGQRSPAPRQGCKFASQPKPGSSLAWRCAPQALSLRFPFLFPAGKAGFCTPSPNGLYEPPCNVTCEGDSECRGTAKCCEYACSYLCMAPSREKAGHCPPPLMKKLHGPALCRLTCAEDRECPAGQKCCETSCGRVCRQPLEDKPGKCPRRRPVKGMMPREAALDTCRQDQECEGWKKCCFTGTSMGCLDVQ